MRILHLTQSLHEGGVTNVVINIVKTFREFEVENIIVTPTITAKILKSLKHYVSSVYLIGGSVKPVNAFTYILARQKLIKKIVQREKPDAIIIQPGWLSLFSHFLPPVPTIVVSHGTYLNEIKYMWFHPLRDVERIRYTTGILLSQAIETFQLRLVSSRESAAVVAVSKNTKKELIQLGIRHNKVISIINGVNKDVFKPMNKNHAKALVEEMFNANLKNKVLLHINPGPIKGTHILIKAIAMLKKVYGNYFTLLIVGKLDPKTYREYIRNMVKGLRLEDDVKLLGYVKNKELPILYSAADLTIVPSYSEGAPLVIPESLACGTPVVATNVGGNPEYLEMVKLKDYLVNVSDYNFHRDLCIKILEALKNTIRVSPDRIPSWKDIGLKYLRLIEYLR